MKITLATNHLDSHGEIISKKVLLDAVEGINSNRKMRWTINHKREIPPLGKIDNAYIEEKDGYCYLKGETIKYEYREELAFDPQLLKESFSSPCCFGDIDVISSDDFKIGVDRNNFFSIAEYQQFKNEIGQLTNLNFKLFLNSRKALLNTPELILILPIGSAIAIVIKSLLKKFGERIGERLADDVYEGSKEKLKELKNGIYRVFVEGRKKLHPKNKKLVTIFEIPGIPHIELFARTDNADSLMKSLSIPKLQSVAKELSQLESAFKVAKIQFILTDKNNWKFNYMITDIGDIIGTKACFKERDKQYQRVTLNKNFGMSVGFSSDEKGW